MGVPGSGVAQRQIRSMALPQLEGSTGESETPTLWVPVYHSPTPSCKATDTVVMTVPPKPALCPDPSSAPTSLSKLLIDSMPNLLICEMGIISAELLSATVWIVYWMSSYYMEGAWNSARHTAGAHT